MKLLSISTASDILSLALVDGDKLLASFISEGYKQHAELISPKIKELVDNNGLKFSQLDGLCVNLGPGSFTGLRVGLSVAKGIAFGANIKLYGYLNFEELLYQAIIKNSIEGKCAVLIPSRKDEFYFGAYEVNEKNYTQLDMFELMTVDQIKNHLHNFRHLIINEKIKRYFDDLADRINLISLKNDAYYGALLVQKNDLKYLCEDYSYLEPLYLKNFDVKLKK